MESTLEIRLLGDFAIMREGRPVPGLDSVRLQALLAYLALHHGAPQLRQQVAFLFWLDSSEAQARTNLRNLLHRLRQAWPEAHHYLDIESRSISWRPNARLLVDVAEFEAHLEDARSESNVYEQIASLRKAVNLYRGDLLPGCYDDWIEPERARLRQAFLQTLEQLSILLRERNDYPGAIYASQRLIQAEPLQEAAYRQLMDLYALNGDRAAALRVYQRCVTTLRQELGSAPDNATQAAYRQLLMPGVPLGDGPVPSVPLDAPLIGRDVEWEQLMLAWRQIAAGRRQSLFVLIRGEAGVGKTRLAADLAGWAQRQKNTVASAACYAPEADLSLMPVAEWLRVLPLDRLAPGLRPELARLLPELDEQTSRAPTPGTSLAEPWEKRRFYEAMARAVLMQREPVLLRLEDVQWSDAETLAWLHYLLRLEGGARLMVVATLRVEQTDPEHPLLPMLSALRQQGRLLEMDLAPLDSAGTAALAANLLGEALSSDAAAALYHHTEGNPLFIIETICRDLECDPSESMLHTLLEASHSDTPDATAPLSPTMQAVLHDRLAALSPGARSLLDVASVIGRSFTGDIVSQAVDLNETEFVTALDELWRRRIVRIRSEDSYDFSHDKLRQTAYQALSPARRRWLHGRVARTLETAERSGVEKPAGQLARHYEAAGQEQRALHYHRLAADSARRHYAFPTAAFHLKRAIACLDGVAQAEEERARLHEQLGDVYALSGQHEEARQAFRTAIKAAHPDNQLVRATLALKVAQTGVALYELEATWDDFEAVLELLGEPEAFGSRHWQVWLDARLGQLDHLYYRADNERMAAMMAEIRSSLEQHGSLQQRATYLLLLLELESRLSRFRLDAEAVTTCRKAVRLACESGDRHLYERCRFGLGFVLLWSGEIEPAASALADVVASSQKVGNVPLLDRSLAYLAVAHRLLGQASSVRELLPRCLAVAEEEQNALYLGVARANQAWLAYRAGTYGEAASHSRFALRQWDKLVFPFQWLARWPLLATALKRGDLVAAIRQAGNMLLPEQQRLPDDIEAALTAARAAHPRRPYEVVENLEVAVALACRIGHL
jgi:DNA-binding SARP family transcriptional activator/tetratricopeptide (TPR) repeat protein